MLIGVQGRDQSIWTAAMPMPRPDSNAIASWMRERVAKDLECSPEEVDVDITFDKLGLDSLAILIATGELAQWLGTELEAATLFEYPTIKELANHLAAS